MFNSTSSHTISRPSPIKRPPNKWWARKLDSDSHRGEQSRCARSQVFKMQEGSLNSFPIEQTTIDFVRFSILHRGNAICKTIIKRTFQGCSGAKGTGRRGTNNLGNEELTVEASE